MKKFVTAVCATALAMFTALPLTAFTSAPLSSVANRSINAIFSEEEMTAVLNEFYAVAGEDRTTYVNDLAAANALDGYFASLGVESSVREFTKAESDSKSYSSYNVVANISSENPDAREVLITACYDNLYSDNPIYLGTKGDGAIYSGTSTATVLKLAEYFSDHRAELKVDVSFVLYGASTSSGYYGTESYLANLEGERLKNLLYYVEIQTIGCDEVYMFSDERTTDARTYVKDVASSSNSIIKEVPTMAARMPIQVLDGIPYTHEGMMGTFTSFFNKGIPCLNIFGASLNDFNIGLNESASRPNVMYTADDTLAKLKTNCPDYAAHMASCAELVVNVIMGDGFLAAATATRNNPPDTSLLTMSWIWTLVLVAIIVGLFVALSFITAAISKKNPIVLPQPKAVKIPIFGMDYEDADPDTIYIDPNRSAPPKMYDPYGTGSVYSDVSEDPNAGAVDSNGINDPFGLDEVAKQEEKTAASERAREAYYGAVIVSKPESEEATEVQPEPASEEQPESQSEPVSEEQPKAQPKPASEEQPESQSEPVSEEQPEAQSDPVSEEQLKSEPVAVKKQSKTAGKSSANGETKPVTKTTAKPAAKAAAKSAVKPANRTAAKSTVKSDTTKTPKKTANKTKGDSVAVKSDKKGDGED